MPERVKVPAPAFVKVAPVPPMMPVMVDVPPLVILIALLLAMVRAAAASTSVVIVRPVNGVPPNAPVNVVSPVPWVLTVNVLAPPTVELKRIVPLLVVVRAVFAPKVTAPV